MELSLFAVVAIWIVFVIGIHNNNIMKEVCGPILDINFDILFCYQVHVAVDSELNVTCL